MTAVYEPSLGELLAWCGTRLAVVVMLTAVVFLFLGWTGRKWNR